MRLKPSLLIAFSVFAALSPGCKKTSTQPSDVFSISTSGTIPATAVAGSDVPVSFVVRQTPSGGTPTPASGKQVTITVTSGGGTINGSSSASIASGSDGLVTGVWRLGTAPGSQGLRASLAAGGSADVAIAASQPPATSLALTTAPGANPVSGVAISPQPALQLKDVNGNNVPEAGVIVTAAIDAGGGTLNGTATATTNASGTATFTNLAILGAAGNRTLKFTATADGNALSVSSTILLAPALLTLAIAPTAGPFSGIPFFNQPVVQVKDGNGNNIAQAGIAVTVAITLGPGTLGVAGFAPPVGQGIAHIASLTVNTDATGKASFSDLTLTGLGTYTLTFSATGYTSITTSAMTVTAPPITALANGVDGVLPGLAAGATTLASFTAPAGALSLRVGIYGGTGTNELYLRRGSYPTSTAFDCFAHVTGPSQLCTATANFAGQWFAVINSPTGSAASGITAYAFGPDCAQQPLVVGTQVSGTLNLATDCPLPIDGATLVPRDRYLLNLASQQTVTFNVTSSNFVALSINDVKSGEVGVSFAMTGGVSVRHVLPAGSYGIDVYNAAGGGAGQSYTLTVVSASTDLGACGVVDVFWEQTVLPLTLANTDCAGTTAGTFSDRLSSGLGFGQVITITMSSTAFDPLLKLLNGQNVTGAGAVLVADDNGGGGTTARIVFGNPGSPPLANRFTIEATSATPGATGAYTLNVDFGPNIYDVPALLRQWVAEPRIPQRRASPVEPRQRQ